MSGNPYEDTAPAAPITHTLDGEHDADFVVIGAGYTGLTAALHAASQGARTLLVEAGEIGQGGSGRNHGHCVPVFGFLDPQAQPRLAALLAGSGARVFGLIREYGIDCEAAPTGALQLAHSPAAMEGLRRQCAFYARLGRNPVLLDRAEARRLTGSDAFHGGWLHPEGGHLNPLAFARGLARAAMQAGARLFTHSPVLELERLGEGWRLRCAGGSIRARRIGIATNAYTGRLRPPLGRSFFRMTAYGMASEPLPAALRRDLLPGNHNLGDTRPDVRYLRFDSRNRLIMGGLVEGALGRDPARSAAALNARLRTVFPAVFDTLGVLRWPWHWTGELAINLDRQPHLYQPAEGLFALLGYSGRGVPTATALGEVLAMAGLGTPAADLPMPISPLRPLWSAPLLSFLVPRLRGPWNRLRSS
ncbi:FAD-binding oxidoreductase [Roseomonas sp. GC11]|uniref:NAD(P)/FAD-dependent oxidoreductase n=1 Tax=Roseomonas sp. GC11 TaxID=2950546 RepID=UPI00210D5AB4|nr:FAD-dependent oxidoreductase [Roseomonas sp. GC11]MCQ4161550.1 FAD-binding oxidoreductase [Roseomonas sp. GC11]